MTEKHADSRATEEKEKILKETRKELGPMYSEHMVERIALLRLAGQD